MNWAYSYHPALNKILYYNQNYSQFSTWRCDLNGSNPVKITDDGAIIGAGPTINGKSLIQLSGSSGAAVVFNGYIMYNGTFNVSGQASYQSKCFIAVDCMNGNVYPVKNNTWFVHGNAFYNRGGELYSSFQQ